MFEVWDWAELAAEATKDARQHVGTLEQKLAESSETVTKLQEQLNSLTQAKQEHENALLQKFSELLNSKKLKIRDQQRLLSTAKLDPEKGKILLEI